MDSQGIAGIAAKIDQITHDYVSKRDNVALTIGVIQQGHHFITGLGQVSHDSAFPPNDQTIYEIGSVTKVFTGTVLAALVHEGTVALDDLIQLYLPEEIVTQLPTSVQSIILRQLATHTAGLPRLPDSFLADIQNPENPYLAYTAPEMYEAIASLALLSEPGQRYEYSNFGMGLLGHLLTLKTSQPYEELVKKIGYQLKAGKSELRVK